MSRDILVISNFYIAFDNLFEFIAKITFSKNSFECIIEIYLKYRF